jgi:NADH-quinone oxidoreductase subunit M
MGILSLLLWLPALGALAVAMLGKKHESAIRPLTLIVSLLVLLLSLVLLLRFDTGGVEVQFAESLLLNPGLGSAYALGVDGLSLPMILLAALLSTVAVMSSGKIKDSIKGYFVCVLVLEFGMLGVFMAQDWALFYIFWEVTLIPLYFLIDRWGGRRRHAASLNFVLYTMGGSIFMLVSLLALSHFNLESDGTLMTSIDAAARGMTPFQQVMVLLGFLIGFGVKMPVFPMHGWLPLAHVEAPGPISILLSGILLKMGAYGMIRVVVMLPEAAALLQPVLVTLALFGMLYGALLAWRQTDLKAMVAYSSVSHMGMVLLGLATLNVTGISGAVLQMTAHGLIAGALFLLVGLLYERTGSLDLREQGGLGTVMPRFTLLMSLTLLAAMGLPGSVSFVSELHTVVGGFQRWGAWMAIFTLTMLVGAAYALRTLGQLFASPGQSNGQAMADLDNRELLASGVLVSLILLCGLFPSALLNLSATTIDHINSEIVTRLAVLQ